jgi:hypothetical protein
MKTLLLLLGAALLAMPVCAAEISYAGQQTRTIKALSDNEVAALRKGEGMGMAKAAELNGYPGPAHVIALANELRLTEDQRRQVQAVFDRMHVNAVALGTEIIEHEQGLDRQFANGVAAADRLAEETGKIADLQGRLRAVHLSAHLETRTLLDPDQIRRYEQLRGYTGPQGPDHRHDHHHG